MTNYIQKLYKKARIEKYTTDYECAHSLTCATRKESGKIGCISCGRGELKTSLCYLLYPVQQVELIEFLGKNFIISLLNYSCTAWGIEIKSLETYQPIRCLHEDLSQALAKLIFQLWDSFTKEQIKEIRRILRSEDN